MTACSLIQIVPISFIIGIVFCMTNSTGWIEFSAGGFVDWSSSLLFTTFVFNDENSVEIMFNRNSVRILVDSFFYKKQKTKNFINFIHVYASIGQRRLLITFCSWASTLSSSKHGETTVSSQCNIFSCGNMLISFPMLYINRTHSEFFRRPCRMACWQACSNGSA